MRERTEAVEELLALATSQTLVPVARIYDQEEKTKKRQHEEFQRALLVPNRKCCRGEELNQVSSLLVGELATALTSTKEVL